VIESAFTGADAARTMDVLRRIVHALHAANSRAVGELGVTAAQLFILRSIVATPGVSLKLLAERTHAAPGSVSEVVSRLIVAGLLERRTSSMDARRIELRVTAAGAKVCAGASETVQEQLVRGFEALSKSQQEALSENLEAWIRHAGLSDGPAAFFFEPNGTSTSSTHRRKDASLLDGR
jgi:DNA-binding MarR family transcriptional regulator